MHKETRDLIVSRIEEHIDELFNELKDLNSGDPMDGDETEIIGQLILARLNWCNGNISTEEYYEIIGGV